MPTALLVIDVQQGLCVGSDAVEKAGRTIDNINQLYERARQAGAPTIVVQHDEKDDLVYGTPDWQLADGLEHHQSPHDIFVRKQGSDAFHETALEQILRDRGVTRLVVCGMQTEFCVESTVRRALALGFEVTIAEDAHTTAPNGILSVDQIVAHHNKTLSSLGSYGARATLVASRDIRFDS
ncbi:hypothetical protein BMF94_4212 [Rhodotorula taiwanensis]|uniref:Isochorismatase-like domain-containing protein n=1 Tax=Rhodotorula taiwanensis TaxID=741276 RepID=A0A2S5B7P7_9BASI|nr:hypothetical protein BMF94_4212 [Rhodotorula taiwanensis]